MKGAARARGLAGSTRRRLVGAVEDARATREADGWLPQPHESHRYRHLLMPTYLDYVSQVSWADHAVSLETAAFLLQICETHRPRRLLDTGSGYSSYVLRRYARAAGAEVVSVETDETWLARTADYLEATGVGSAGLVSWTDFRRDPGAPYGLVFHDLAGGDLRERTMPLVTDLVSADGALVFDDMQHDGHRAQARRVTAAAGRRYVSLRRVTRDAIGRYAALSVR